MPPSSSIPSGWAVSGVMSITPSSAGTAGCESSTSGTPSPSVSASLAWPAGVGSTATGCGFSVVGMGAGGTMPEVSNADAV